MLEQCKLSYRRILWNLKYTVSELEVRFLKRLEMIEKLNNFDITCLHLQVYKKEFAFSTKFHYFSDQKLHILHLKKQIFFFIKSRRIMLRKGDFQTFEKKILKKIFFFQS